MTAIKLPRAINPLLLLLIRLQRVKGLLHQPSPEIFFFGGRKFGVAGDMDNSGSQDHTIRTDHFGDWQG